VSDRGEAMRGKRELGSSCVRGSVGSVATLQRVGFDALSLANNHGMDFGAEALLHSLELLHGHGMATAGGGRTLTSARTPAILTKGGVRVAMLAYTSVFPAFGYAATPDSPGLATISVSTSYEAPHNVPYQPGTPATTVTIPDAADVTAMLEDVRLAKMEADLVVVQFHWGVVGLNRPLGYMRHLGRAAVDAGADLVIGNHPHVLQGLEFYNEKLICYSLNHFAFEHIGHIFPAWPFVHDTLILAATIDEGRFQDFGLVPVTMERVSHDLSLSGGARSAEVAEHLTRISAEFGTVVAADSGRLTVSPPAVPLPRADAPQVFRDSSSVVLDAQGVLARAAAAAH
jgi:poly-gamma-glutamate capsule biosynthesis protein CapA/YwtB (metallophosphatase superfamily)